MKLRTIIFFTFLCIGFFPLVTSILLNLPPVLTNLEQAVLDKRLSQLQEKFFVVSREVERRKESLRVLSMLPGPRDITAEKPKSLAPEVAGRRLAGLAQKWFGSQSDVQAVILLDRLGNERFRVKQNGQGKFVHLRSEEQGDLIPESVFLEGLKMPQGHTFVGDVSLVYDKTDGRHLHKGLVILGTHVLDQKQEMTGLALLQIDFHQLFPVDEEYLLVRHDGTYITSPSYAQDEHDHQKGEAFLDFPDLPAYLAKSQPAIVADSKGRKFAWMPVLMDTHADHSLWLAQPIDRSAIELWLAKFKRTLFVIVLVLTLALIVVSSLYARYADQVRSQLMAGLDVIFEKGEKPGLSWPWPEELNELSVELDLLAEKHIAADLARSKAETVLKEEKELALVTLSSIGDAVIATDTEQRVTRMNVMAEQLTGWRREDVIGRSICEVFHVVNAFTRERVECPVSKALTTGTTVELSLFSVLRAKDGREYRVADSASPIRSGEGEVQGVVLVFRDVSEEVELQEKLEHELAVKQILSETSKNLIGSNRDYATVSQVILEGAQKMTGSEHGYVATVDQKSGNLVCHTFTKMMGESCHVHGDGQRVEFAAGPDGIYPTLWGKSLNDEKGFYTNNPVEHPVAKGLPEGHIAIDRFLSVPILMDGELFGQIGLANAPVNYGKRDLAAVERLGNHFIQAVKGVREREARDKLLSDLRQAQKMEAVGTLAGGVAHDFNNMLTPILGFTELSMVQLPEGDKMRKGLVEVKKAAMRAKNLVQQILTFSRQQDQELVCVSLEPIVKESLRLLRSSLPTTIEFREKIESTGSVMADPTQIQQVLINLCTNAAHAMEDHGGVLEVQLGEITVNVGDPLVDQHLRAGRYVRLVVADNGGGMDPATKERIFEPYFTTKEQGKGTGIGLALVHGIVKGHGGRVSVYSEKGQGSTFHVYLPVSLGEDSFEEEATTQLPRGNERVLLVDDEESVVKMLQEMLEFLGYQVVALTNSIEAYRVFREKAETFDLVITDQTMPGLTGDELAKKMLHLRPELPIVLCTGFSEMLTEEKAREIGLKAYIMKPVVISELGRVMRSVLDSDKEEGENG